MGMDHWIEYNYIDEDGDEVSYEIVEWRKQYWINTVICNYLGNDNDGVHNILLEDIIALRNYFQLCIDNPKLISICETRYAPFVDTLVMSVNEINNFLRDFGTTELTGEFKYIVSV